MEAMIRRLHTALQAEMSRASRLEEELIARSREAPSRNIEAIEKKYRELKARVEKADLATAAKVRSLEATLVDCFDLFTAIFESIVENKHHKSQAYDDAHRLMMEFFDRHNGVMGQLGYQEKLIQILQTYQLRKSASSKKKRDGWPSPTTRLEAKFVHEDKENVGRTRAPFRPIQQTSDLQRFSAELDSNDSLSNYDFQLHQ